MFEFIRDHALNNVWCNPKQDLQAIVKPQRITPRVGVWNTFEAVKTLYKTPEPVSRFHIYQIGKLNPGIMGLLDDGVRWIKLSEACNKESLIADVYVSSGIQFPRSQCWYLVTPDQNVLLAVKEQPRIPVNLQTEPVYFRFYSNAFFESVRSNDLSNDVYVFGTTPTNTNQILELQNAFEAYQQKPGHTYAFVNGFKVSKLDLITVQPGDVAEFVHDSSIKRVVDLPLKDLRAFLSTLDNMHKYLLHYPGMGDGTIDYHDDLDFFLTVPTPGGRHKGVFYHRNGPKGVAVRMLTHKDYAIPTDYVDAYLAAQKWKHEDVTVRFHIRNSGYERPLVNENSRIKELYKMSDEDVMSAMLSVDSLVPVWEAANLERAGYPAVMRSVATAIPSKLIQDAYGYNAVSKLLADTPSFIKNFGGRRVVEVPYGLQYNATAYEYDADGLLIGYYRHLQGMYYQAKNDATVLVELIAGNGTTFQDEIYGSKSVAIDPSGDYRYYICDIASGRPLNNWVDVTGTDKVAVINGVAYFNVDITKFYTLVRGNKNFLAYDLELDNSEGLLKFSLTQEAQRDGKTGTYVMQIPRGELDLWLNRRALIENLDYYVSFPEVVITNKKFLDESGTQKITIRMTGFCNADMSREAPKDKGFISHGLLSHNNRYDIRDDKVQRFVVNGAVYDRSELKFDENDLGVAVPDATNGMPYAIRDIVVPLRGLTEESTYPMRAKSLVIDKQISDYMTSKMPAQVFDTPNVIPGLYPVISPFCAKIIADLVKGDLVDDRLLGFYSDADVFDICKPYEYLLKFDPTQEGNLPDEEYVIIHPHQLNTVIDVNLYAYKFLMRVVKLYLKNRVNLSSFLRLSE